MKPSYLNASFILFCMSLLFSSQTNLLAQDVAEITELKERASDWVGKNEKLSQVMVDKVFSFSELGFQEVESS